MTPSELKYYVEQAGHAPYFFTPKTMRFFGDRMSNYGVKEGIVDTYTESNIPVWELYRKKPVRNGEHSSAYFHKESFRRVLPKREWENSNAKP